MKKFLIAIVVMFTIGVTSAQSKEKLEQKFEQLEKKLDETHKEYEAKLDKYHKDLSKNEKIDDAISDEDLEKLEIDDEFSDKRHNTPKGKDEDDDDENDNDDKDDDKLVSKKDLEDFENFDKNISVKEKMKIFVETHEEGKKEIGDVKDTDFFDDKQPHKEIAKVAVQEKEYMKFLEKYDNEINKIHNEMYKVAKKYIAKQ